MNVIEIPGANMNLAESQDEYITLPVRAANITVVCNDGEVAEVPSLTSGWVPTPEELAELNAGGHIELTVLGVQQPPVMLNVAPEPREPAADEGDWQGISMPHAEQDDQKDWGAWHPPLPDGST